MRSVPCERCGIVTPDGQARVSVSLSLDDLEEFASVTLRANTRARLLCAIELLDPDRAARIRSEFVPLDDDWG